MFSNQRTAPSFPKKTASTSSTKNGLIKWKVRLDGIDLPTLGFEVPEVITRYQKRPVHRRASYEWCPYR